MRTPLATIAIGANSLRKFLPLYQEGYLTAKRAGLKVPAIKPFENSLLKDIPATMEKVSNNAQNIIDMLLIRAKKIPEKEFDKCSISKCIEIALEQYPLKAAERNIICWDRSKDFFFRGKEEMAIHILFNLLKNSLFELASVPNAQISISLASTDLHNCLHFKDNGRGVPLHIMRHLFDHFVSGTQFGTGMGLAYCRMAMTTFGGHIEYLSLDGAGSEFVLKFPKV
jgi:signal transduction histidine kinase